eukprot:5653939-Amphidinium_carterae.1
MRSLGQQRELSCWSRATYPPQCSRLPVAHDTDAIDIHTSQWLHSIIKVNVWVLHSVIRQDPRLVPKTKFFDIPRHLLSLGARELRQCGAVSHRWSAATAPSCRKPWRAALSSCCRGLKWVNYSDDAASPADICVHWEGFRVTMPPSLQER